MRFKDFLQREGMWDSKGKETPGPYQETPKNNSRVQYVRPGKPRGNQGGGGAPPPGPAQMK